MITSGPRGSIPSTLIRGRGRSFAAAAGAPSARPTRTRTAIPIRTRIRRGFYRGGKRGLDTRGARVLGLRLRDARGGAGDRGVERAGELDVERVARLPGVDPSVQGLAQQRQVADEVED